MIESVRIGRVFGRRRAEHAVLIASLMAGVPSAERTVEWLLALERAGADMLMVEVPFSDPTLGGAEAQAAAKQALGVGTDLARVFDIVAAVRSRSEIPIILRTYMNPMIRRGLPTFAVEAKEAGADAILTADLPAVEGHAVFRCLRAAGLVPVIPVAATSSPSRRRAALREACGFVLAVEAGGAADPSSLIRDLKALTDLPIALQPAEESPGLLAFAAGPADAVVIGPTLARFAGQDVAGRVGSVAGELARMLPGRG